MSEQITTKPEQQHQHETLLALPTPDQAEKLRRNEKDPRLSLQEARTTVAETVRAEPNPTR